MSIATISSFRASSSFRGAVALLTPASQVAIGITLTSPPSPILVTALRG